MSHRSGRSGGGGPDETRGTVAGYAARGMEPAMWASILSEWASLIFRWLHVIAAVGWIGSSFYFIHLDLELKPRSGLPEGAHGEAWQVDGGGFYPQIQFPVSTSA